MKGAAIVLCAALCTSCWTAGAYGLAEQTAGNIHRLATQYKQTITEVCTKLVDEGKPYAEVRCLAALDAYDRAVATYDALRDALYQAQLLGENADEAALAEAALEAMKALRALEAAVRALEL